MRVSGSRFLIVPDLPSIIGRGHYAIEERLLGSGVKWVILRPGLFMQNTFTQAASIKNDSKIVLPFAADLPLAFIDVRDTGAVGARVLLDPMPTWQNLRIHWSPEQFRRICRCVLTGIGPQDHLCCGYSRAGRAGDEGTRDAGLANHPPTHRRANSSEGWAFYGVNQSETLYIARRLLLSSLSRTTKGCLAEPASRRWQWWQR